MNAEQARQLLAFIDTIPARARRYELEGGTLQVWKCHACGWCTAAEDNAQARAKLSRCTAQCSHTSVRCTGEFMPPLDFS